nr:hypothetical protein BaRGS_002102 [Batillaria attramentaria]
MSRSKSYDESVARRAATDDEKIRNSGSNPDTTAEKRSLLRGNSANRLSMDGRRNGLYIPSDESDTELKPEDKSGTRRPSSAKSDSPKSVSRLSIKSTNTSTETLQAERDSDGDSSPEQRRRSYAREGEVFERSSTVTPSSTRPSSASSVDSERPRRYSHLDRSSVETAVSNLQDKVQLYPEEDPLNSMAKWRLRRERKRLSVYDNVSDSDSGSLSPRNRAHAADDTSHHKSDVNDLKNEVGSRSSYASSYASSTDRDEGFESMSGTVSQRTSLSSTLESEIVSTPILSRKAESQRMKRDSGLNDRTVNGEPAARAVNGDIFVSSVLSEDSRKQRTETWDGGSAASDVTRTSRPTTPSDAPKGKAAKVPSYMRSTNSSLRARGPGQTDPAPTFKRDAAARQSFRGKESTLKRDSAVRASMRAESAFKRDTPARTSMRGPRVVHEGVHRQRHVLASQRQVRRDPHHEEQDRF